MASSSSTPTMGVKQFMAVIPTNLMKQVQLESLRSEITPALSPWTNFKLGLP